MHVQVLMLFFDNKYVYISVTIEHYKFRTRYNTASSHNLHSLRVHEKDNKLFLSRGSEDSGTVKASLSIIELNTVSLTSSFPVPLRWSLILFTREN